MQDLRTFRSLGVNVVAWGTSVALVVIMVVIGRSLPEGVGFSAYQVGTLWVLIAIWSFGMFLITRSRVKAGPEGIDIINGWKRHEFTWDEVAHISMTDAAPWPTLVTKDERTVTLFGIQGSDGAKAREAVTWLRSHIQ